MPYDFYIFLEQKKELQKKNIKDILIQEYVNGASKIVNYSDFVTTLKATGIDIC